MRFSELESASKINNGKTKSTPDVPMQHPRFLEGCRIPTLNTFVFIRELIIWWIRPLPLTTMITWTVTKTAPWTKCTFFHSEVIWAHHQRNRILKTIMLETWPHNPLRAALPWLLTKSQQKQGTKKGKIEHQYEWVQPSQTKYHICWDQGALSLYQDFVPRRHDLSKEESSHCISESFAVKKRHQVERR